MNRQGPIIIIEDDIDDQEIMEQVFQSLSCSNKIIFFSDAEEALNFLTESTIYPFIIFSDINMPKLNGIELREKIHENENLRLKSIPYLLFSTTAEQDHIVNAYSKSIQGFFIKPNNYTELHNTIKTIMEYWSKCVAPNYIK